MHKRRFSGFPRTGPWALFLGLALAGSVRGAIEATFDFQPRVLTLGEAARVTVTVRGVDAPARPEFPPVDGFQIQFIGSQQRTQIVNRDVTREVGFEYRFVPVRAGVFQIGPFRYDVSGQTVEWPAMSVEVAAQATGQGEADSLSDQLFAVMEAPRQDLVVQETIPIRLAVYMLPDIPVAPEMQLNGMPESGVTLSKWEELERTRERVNNRVYEVRRFQARLRPLTAGSLELAPTLRLMIRVPRQRPQGGIGDPVFDRFFSNPFFNQVEQRPIDLIVQPLLLKVRAFPEEG
ncbi:MAG: BatD family protein, partial [Kiritimatiellia bacterium]|nr:BatD family protein [Kiritimatiellia bacterium]